MKKLIALSLILVFASCKKENLDPNLIKEFDIQSTEASANYHIKIALPENYDPSKHKYASIYLLDGDDNFNFVADNCKKISQAHSTSNIVVVSIGYGNDRAFDYTPSKVEKGSGGGDNFMKFLATELIPQIESDFGVDTVRSSRIILGHSYGGLLAAYAFTNFNQVFGNYIMLSPSLWYDNELLLRLENEHRDANKNVNQLVYLGMGALESSGRMLAPFEAFRLRMQNYYNNIHLKSHIEPQLDHLGSKNPNIVEALNFYFQN